MAKVLVEFYMKRARVDPSTIEDKVDKRAVNKALLLVRRGQYAEAVKALQPLDFEWNWDNGDGDPSEMFTESGNLNFKLSAKNSTIKVGEWDGALVITAAVYFELSLKKGVSRSVAQDWMDEKSMFFCGYIGRGWLYSDDDGGGVNVLAPQAKRSTRGTTST